MSCKVDWKDPLHFSNFFEAKQRHHHSSAQKRQSLILYVADLHKRAMCSGMPRAMINIPIRLMDLRDWCQDYRVVLDKFFDVQQLGYYIDGDSFELSTITPKESVPSSASPIMRSMKTFLYAPPPLPDVGVISKVYVQQHKAQQILDEIIRTKRLDLQAPVQWILGHPELNFHFIPAGRLQQRDTSIWPVKAIEVWPSWLREMLFGPGLDIDAAYTQFLMSSLEKVHKDKGMIQSLYPDLIRSIQDKAEWRAELCKDVLGLELTEENISLVKKICMSLANGSKISAPILLSNSSFSVTADIIIQNCDSASPEKLIRIGERFNQIAKQYTNARRIVCLANRQNITRKNQKNVFNSYFEWERKARYAIWESCDRHGIMVHDGIDGIPKAYLDKLPEIMQDLNLKITN